MSASAARRSSVVLHAAISVLASEAGVQNGCYLLRCHAPMQAAQRKSPAHELCRLGRRALQSAADRASARALHVRLVKLPCRAAGLPSVRHASAGHRVGGSAGRQDGVGAQEGALPGNSAAHSQAGKLRGHGTGLGVCRNCWGQPVTCEAAGNVMTLSITS